MNIINANESCIATAVAQCAAVTMPQGVLLHEQTNATVNSQACETEGLFTAPRRGGYGIAPPPPPTSSICSYIHVVDSVIEDCNATAIANCGEVDISDPGNAVANCQRVHGCIYTYVPGENGPVAVCLAADFDACNLACIGCSEDEPTSRHACEFAGGGRSDGTPSTCTYTPKVVAVEEACVATALYACARVDISANTTISERNCKSIAGGWCTYTPQGTAFEIGEGALTTANFPAPAIDPLGRRRLQAARYPKPTQSKLDVWVLRELYCRTTKLAGVQISNAAADFNCHS
jgi:hypothetical protein